MKIEREVNGQKLVFELTNEELYGAYLEKEHEYDRQDVIDELESYNFNDSTRQDFKDIYGISLDKVLGNDELIDELACEKRHNQDHYGMEWTYARDDAMKDVLGERKLELRGLPERCYGILPSSGEIIVINRGEAGYYRTDFASNDEQGNKDFVDNQNSLLLVSKAQAAAMFAGSMFGWDVPGADPAAYDENGALKPVEKPSLDSVISAAEEEKGSVDTITDGKSPVKEEAR